jgi:hypothetical protein
MGDAASIQISVPMGNRPERAFGSLPGARNAGSLTSDSSRKAWTGLSVRDRRS